MDYRHLFKFVSFTLFPAQYSSTDEFFHKKTPVVDPFRKMFQNHAITDPLHGPIFHIVGRVPFSSSYSCLTFIALGIQRFCVIAIIWVFITKIRISHFLISLLSCAALPFPMRSLLLLPKFNICIGALVLCVVLLKQ